MNTLLIFIGIFGAALAVSGVVIRQRNISEEPIQETAFTPSPTSLEASTASPVPTITPQDSFQQQAAPTEAAQPSSTPAPTSPPATQASLAIRALSLPTRVQGGQEFTIRWTVEGPGGTAVNQTSAEVVYTQSGNGSSVNSRSEQSFGSTSVGQEHAGTFSFGSGPGEITVTLRATANGKEVSSVHTISVL